jgi:regulator of telomere elongation helicase 1
MPTYNVAGVPVDFPFEAYPVQLVYMEKVVIALERGENALLESPTGTGKTLCLLCAALGWRRAHIERHRATTPVAPPPGGLREANWVEDLAASIGADRSGAGAVTASEGRSPRIIYASRTHSQLQQVVRELRRTVHRPLVCMLGSREQFCCHPEVRKQAGTALNAACQALTAANECSFYRRLQDEKRKQGGSLPHPQASEPEASRAVPDIEDFKSHAERRLEICPFYLSRELQASSDVLFLPYNYLLDPKSRKALNICLQRDVLIFDEAHNVDKVCADAASLNLTTIEIAGAVRELDRCIDGARNRGGGADADAVDDDGDVSNVSNSRSLLGAASRDTRGTARGFASFLVSP